tara:strand:- start:281 stop:499 length:219 start_codon:yes stop_codon:yes gene_type:complete
VKEKDLKSAFKKFTGYHQEKVDKKNGHILEVDQNNIIHNSAYELVKRIYEMAGHKRLKDHCAERVAVLKPLK